MRKRQKEAIARPESTGSYKNDKANLPLWAFNIIKKIESVQSFIYLLNCISYTA